MEVEATDELVPLPGFLEQRYIRAQNGNGSWGENQERPPGQAEPVITVVGLGVMMGENRHHLTWDT